jgi:hypothetical protein
MGILSIEFAYEALWTLNPFEILCCLLDHLILIPSVGFRIVILLIAVHSIIDSTRLVTVCEMET